MPILVGGASLRVLVIGGGAVAARKLAAFLEAGADVRVVAPRVTDDIRALSEAGKVAWLSRDYAPADLADAQLVIVATNDRAVNEGAAADAHGACRLVNVADEPDAGNFTMMAAHRSGPLVVGVSAGGVPGAAARVRDAIAHRFDSRYARALEQLAALRRDALDRGDREGWRELARGVVDGDFCREVEEGTIEAKVSSWR